MSDAIGADAVIEALPWIRGYARKLARRTQLDPEDLAQEACAALLAMRHRFNPDLGAWDNFARRLAYVAMIGVLRRETGWSRQDRRPRVVTVDPQSPTSVFARLAVPNGAEDGVLLREVGQALWALPAQMRFALVQVCWFEMPAIDVARRLGVTKQRVSNMVQDGMFYLQTSCGPRARCAERIEYEIARRRRLHRPPLSARYTCVRGER